LEEILGILECRLQIVKLWFQFYIFGEEIAVGNFIYLGKKEQNIFSKSINLVLENCGHYQPN
jgi:hypothetical protein